jgi:hypothetical protein
MLDAIALAATTVTVLSPYFLEAAKGAAGKAGEEAYAGGKKLVSWLREKLFVNDTKALDRVAADPSNVDNQAALRVSLSETLAAADPALVHELNALVDSASQSMPKFAVSQNASQSGNSNVSAQAAGQNNRINIGKNN